MKVEKRTILFLTPSLNKIAGAEKSLINLINILEETGQFTIHVGTFSKLEDVILPLNSNVNLFSFGGLAARQPILWKKIKEVSHEINPSIICAWTSLPAILVMALRKKLKYEKIFLAFRDAIDAYKIQLSMWQFQYHIYSYYINNKFNKADVILCNSNENLSDFQKKLGNGPKYNWIPNCVQAINYNQVDSTNQVKLRKEGSLNIVFVGRIAYQKGLDVLLQAIEYIKDEIPINLIIVGDGSKRNELTKYVKRAQIEDKIQWVGFQKDVLGYYKIADVIVLPSRHEGLPNVLLESMLLGKPVIAAKCKTGPKELTDNGKVGLLFKVGDFKALGNHLIYAYRNPQIMIALGIKGKSFILENYSYQATSIKYKDAFINNLTKL